MIHNTFILDKRYPDCTLTTYICDNPAELNMPPRRAMIVCPGGGYHFLSEREAEPIVKFYLYGGMNVFLLRYSVGDKAKDYAPLIEAALAVKHIRENAGVYNIDAQSIFICGFSAGGHLAASAGILWNIPKVKEALGDCAEGINRPNGMILSYPVITAGPKAHKGSIDNICGDKNAGSDIRDLFSLEKHVDEMTSPAFIWHTFDDKTVPVENSLLLAAALAESKVPFELHVFPHGKHGLSLANRETWCHKQYLLEPHVQCWAELSLKWIEGFPLRDDIPIIS